MKNLKKLLCMVLCLALMQSVAFAAPSAGSLCEIYEPIIKIGNPMTGNDTMAKAATSAVTFADTTLNYDRGAFGTNLKREFVAGRSGAEGDYAMKISANVSNSFGGLGSLNACGWSMFYDDVADAYAATMEGKPVVVEFDIKVDTTNDIYGLLLYRTWAVSGNDSYYIFNADGKIVGTDYAYEANKWYHFRWEIDGKKAYVDITPDGGETTRIVNGAWSDKGIDNTYQGTFFLTQETARGDGDTKAGMTIDNWRHYYYTKPANGTIVSPEGTSVPSGENFIFRVTAEAAAGDEIDLRVDGTTIATFDAKEGIYDYAADVDHCSIDAGAHVLSAYKVTDGFEEKIAEKIVSIAGKAAGAIPTEKGNYPTGVETFDNLDKYLLSDYLSIKNSEAYVSGDKTGSGIMENGASGLPGDKSARLTSFGEQRPWHGLHIIDNNTWFTKAGVLELEFDIMTTTTTDSVALYGLGALWHDDPNANPTAYANSYHKTIFLNENGKVSGTDVEYKANEWMHFKIQYDYEREKWNVWKDTVKIVEDADFIPQDAGLNETYNYLVLSVLSSKSGEAAVQLDNLSLHQWINAPTLASVSYATDSASGIATTDLSVTDAAKSVTLTLDKDVDAVGDANVEVLVNDVAKTVSGVSYSAKAVTIPLPAISAGDKVSVTLKGVKAAGAEIGNISATLTVKATGLYIAQNKIIGSSIKTQMYNGGAEKEAMLIAVVFDGNRMTDVSIKRETIPSGEKVYTFPLKEAPGAKQVKLMVWDNGLQPISEKIAD